MQSLRLRRLIQHAAQNSPYYRSLLATTGIRADEIRGIDDLRRLPFTTPDDFRNTAEFLAVPRDRIGHIFSTSGTSKKPVRVALTHADFDRCINLLAAITRRGIWKDERPVCMIYKPQGLWAGGRYVEEVISRLGGLNLSVGVPPLAETLELIREFQPNMLATNPSYMAALTCHAQSVGFRHRFKAISLGGELMTPAQAQLFRDYWGAEVSNGYGLVEIGGVATGGNDCDALHLDLLHNVVEVLDPETGEPADEGELVVTTLVNEAMPLIRYRTRDRVRRAVCRCGWSAPAIQVLSRINDSLVIAAVNIHCPLLADSLLEFETKTTSVEIIAEHASEIDRMTVRVGVLPESQLQAEGVKQALFRALPDLDEELRAGSYELVVDVVRTQELPAKLLRVRDLRH
jgi:phenylacetate-CoA ligase